MCVCVCVCVCVVGVRTEVGGEMGAKPFGLRIFHECFLPANGPKRPLSKYTASPLCFYLKHT